MVLAIILAFIIPLSLLFWFVNVLSYVFSSSQGMTQVRKNETPLYKNVAWAIIPLEQVTVKCPSGGGGGGGGY